MKSYALVITIKQITAQETHPVRHAVLRKGRPVADCVFAGDDLATTVHLGAYDRAHLLGVATLVQHKDKEIAALTTVAEQYCYQLRGMAVLENQQGRNVGKQLLQNAEQRLKENGCEHLWFNAREIAVPFYLKQGYQVVSAIFEIQSVGMHYKMYKKL